MSAISFRTLKPNLMHSGTFERVGTVAMQTPLLPASQTHFVSLNIGIHVVALCVLPSCTALKLKEGRRAVGGWWWWWWEEGSGELRGGGGRAVTTSERQQRWTLTPRDAGASFHLHCR